MLAHYLARYDGGRYARLLLEDDIHQVNADKIGISRKQVKTVTYAFCMEQVTKRLDTAMTHQLSSVQERRKERDSYRLCGCCGRTGSATWSILKKASEKGSIKSIDGRKIEVDSPHKALNYLLQSGAGVVAKAMDGHQPRSYKQTLCASSTCIHP